MYKYFEKGSVFIYDTVHKWIEPTEANALWGPQRVLEWEGVLEHVLRTRPRHRVLPAPPGSVLQRGPGTGPPATCPAPSAILIVAAALPDLLPARGPGVGLGTAEPPPEPPLCALQEVCVTVSVTACVPMCVHVGLCMPAVCGVLCIYVYTCARLLCAVSMCMCVCMSAVWCVTV